MEEVEIQEIPLSAAQSFSPSHAVVLDSVPSASLDDYLRALARVLQPKSVTHISRVSEDNVCVFLDTEAHVEAIVRMGVLEVGGVHATSRRLAFNPSRVLITNCLPFLSDSSILGELSKIGKVLSSLRSVPAGSKLPRFGHVLSFSKWLYMAFEEAAVVPETVVVSFRETKFPVHLALEKLPPLVDPLFIHQDSPDVPFVAEALPKKATSGSRFRSPVDAFLARHPAAAILGAAPEAQETDEHTDVVKPMSLSRDQLRDAKRRKGVLPAGTQASVSQFSDVVQGRKSGRNPAYSSAHSSMPVLNCQTLDRGSDVSLERCSSSAAPSALPTTPRPDRSESASSAVTATRAPVGSFLSLCNKKRRV